ncbi:MAG: tRNA (adenosine(37)-N6)-dimethylallyltransferase MiaA [Alphaproteobacteria bacterium]|nr:tRNA (adenosine(37)-N6)-dimethylallyltransferase MiaA [Alphaproteobacteria bacterium]
MPESIPVLIVAGPTASGKSALALRLAEALDGEVINADSMQVYRELRILTGRPNDEDLARAPHRLYGVLTGAERCSVGRWRALAVEAIVAADESGRLPIVAGGTGLYLKALVEGLAPIPDIPLAFVQDAARRHEALGGAAMHEALAARDPAGAARIPAADKQRLVRAWAVLDATGRPLADWQAETGTPELEPFAFHSILLDPPRDALYAACDARFDGMMAAGALDEVRALEALSLDPELPLMKAVGVPELRRHLAGELPLEAAVAQAKQATRNYAKRQFTWFRHQLHPSATIGAQYSESFDDEIFPNIRQFLLTQEGRTGT